MLAVLAAALISQAPPPGYYTEEEAQAVFTAANDAYSREDYAQAREGYQKLLAHGHGGADVLYNLGTACLAMGDLGEAVLYLERARRAGGRAEDVEQNLQLARARQLDKVVGGQTEEPFVLRVVLATSDRVVGAIFLAAWILAFLGLTALRLLPAGRRAAAVALTAVGFVISAPSGALLAAHAYVRTTLHEGVVLARSAPARELPRESGKVAFEVHAGLKVQLLEESGKYVRIRLPNGLEGWTEKDAVTAL
jgi:tetratricopeptide (TPR) repeat protein